MTPLRFGLLLKARVSPLEKGGESPSGAIRLPRCHYCALSEPLYAGRGHYDHFWLLIAHPFVPLCITSVRMLNRTHGETDCLENLGKPPGEGSINRLSDLFNRFSFNTCMWQEQCKTLIYKELGTKRVVFGRQLTINSP